MQPFPQHQPVGNETELIIVVNEGRVLVTQLGLNYRLAVLLGAVLKSHLRGRNHLIQGGSQFRQAFGLSEGLVRKYVSVGLCASHLRSFIFHEGETPAQCQDCRASRGLIIVRVADHEGSARRKGVRPDGAPVQELLGEVKTFRQGFGALVVQRNQHLKVCVGEKIRL